MDGATPRLRSLQPRPLRPRLTRMLLRFGWRRRILRRDERRCGCPALLWSGGMITEPDPHRQALGPRADPGARQTTSWSSASSSAREAARACSPTSSSASGCVWRRARSRSRWDLTCTALEVADVSGRGGLPRRADGDPSCARESRTPTSSKSPRRPATKTSCATTMTTGEVGGERRVFYRPDRLRRRRRHDRRALRLLRGQVPSPSGPTTPTRCGSDGSRPVVFVSADHRGFPITQRRIDDDMGYELSLVPSAERLAWMAGATPLARSPTWATASPTSRLCGPSAPASRPPTRSRRPRGGDYVTQRRAATGRRRGVLLLCRAFRPGRWAGL